MSKLVITLTLLFKFHVCMLREVQSTADGHHEYLMTCEAKEVCVILALYLRNRFLPTQKFVAQYITR